MLLSRISKLRSGQDSHNGEGHLLCAEHRPPGARGPTLLLPRGPLKREAGRLVSPVGKCPVGLNPGPLGGPQADSDVGPGQVASSVSLQPGGTHANSVVPRAPLVHMNHLPFTRPASESPHTYPLSTHPSSQGLPPPRLSHAFLPATFPGTRAVPSTSLLHVSRAQVLPWTFSGKNCRKIKQHSRLLGILGPEFTLIPRRPMLRRIKSFCKIGKQQFRRKQEDLAKTCDPKHNALALSHR